MPLLQRSVRLRHRLGGSYLSMPMNRLYRRLALTGLGALCVFGVSARVTEAACVTFCGYTHTAEGVNNGNPFTMIVMTAPAGTCQTAQQCAPANCATIPNATQRSVNGAGGAREFCNSDLRRNSPSLAQGSAWCNDLDRVVGDRCIPDQSTTPPPAPNKVCRFQCMGGDNVAQDQVVPTTCSVDNDCNAVCERHCRQVQVSNGSGRTTSATCFTTRRAPSCENPPPPAPPTPTSDRSVGGITDTREFETINEVFGNISITAFIGAVVKTLIGFAGALFLLMLLWAGFRWTTSGGEQKGVVAAQTTLRNAVIGIVVVATSYVLVTAIIELIGRATAMTP